MTDKISDLTQSVQAALRELQNTDPDAGFIVIGLSEAGPETSVSIAFNIDDESMRDTLTSIADDKGTSIFPIPMKKLLN